MSRCSEVGTMTERSSARSIASSRGSDELLLSGGIKGRSTSSLCSCDADKYVSTEINLLKLEMYLLLIYYFISCIDAIEAIFN